MTQLYFAILAHNARPCLEDLVLNLRAFAPGAEVVLFNGGHDPGLAAGLDVPVCPASRPARRGSVDYFHYAVMRWLHDEGRAYDFLVTLDSDMLLIKPGLAEYLEQTMANSLYMANNFMETPPGTDWPTGRFHWLKWKQVWQPIFGTRNPYGCFNPGQVFRREYVERLMAFPKLPELLAAIERSHMPAMEEMIYPTLAVALDAAPLRHPGSQVPPRWDIPGQTSALRVMKRHSPADIRAYLADPNVHLIHPVPLDMAAPERQLVRMLRDGRPVDYAAFQKAFDAYQPIMPWRKRLRAHVGRVVRPTYFRLIPE